MRKRQAESPYRDWYIVQSFDDPATPQNEFRYKGWWGVDTLPEFADNEAGDDLHAGPEAVRLRHHQALDGPQRRRRPGRRHRRLAARRGQRSADRLLARLARAGAEINPEGYTVAEVWDDARQFLDDGGFSATMNYHGFAFPVKGFLIDESLRAERLRPRARRAAQGVSAGRCSTRCRT